MQCDFTVTSWTRTDTISQPESQWWLFLKLVAELLLNLSEISRRAFTRWKALARFRDSRRGGHTSDCRPELRAPARHFNHRQLCLSSSQTRSSVINLAINCVKSTKSRTVTLNFCLGIESRRVLVPSNRTDLTLQRGLISRKVSPFCLTGRSAEDPYGSRLWSLSGGLQSPGRVGGWVSEGDLSNLSDNNQDNPSVHPKATEEIDNISRLQFWMLWGTFVAESMDRFISPFDWV